MLSIELGELARWNAIMAQERAEHSVPGGEQLHCATLALDTLLLVLLSLLFLLSLCCSIKLFLSQPARFYLFLLILLPILPWGQAEWARGRVVLSSWQGLNHDRGPCTFEDFEARKEQAWSSSQISWQKGEKSSSLLNWELLRKNDQTFLPSAESTCVSQPYFQTSCSVFSPWHVSPCCYVLCDRSSLRSPAVAAGKPETTSRL